MRFEVGWRAARGGPTEAPGDSVEPCAPAVEDLVDVGSYSVTRFRAVDARHQQVVVVGVAVTHRRHHRERDRRRVKSATGSGSSDPAATAITSMRRYRLSPRLGATGEDAGDLTCEITLKLDVFVRPSLMLTVASSRPRILISQALSLGPLDRWPFDEHTLALIALACATETHEDRRQATVLARPACQRRVSRWQEHEVREIRTRHAQRTAILHHQPAPIRAATTSARPVLQRRYHHEIRRTTRHTHTPDRSRTGHRTGLPDRPHDHVDHLTVLEPAPGAPRRARRSPRRDRVRAPGEARPGGADSRGSVDSGAHTEGQTPARRHSPAAPRRSNQQTSEMYTTRTTHL